VADTQRISDAGDESVPEGVETAGEFAENGDLPGQLLADDDLGEPEQFRISPDETDAEELIEADDPTDDTRDEGDPEDVVIDDEEQLSRATTLAKSARSTRPVKRNLTVAPVKKAQLTPKQRDARTKAVVQRTTPAAFVKQAIGELKKVVWPTGDALWQYFVVVLIFVVLIMAVVSLLDLLFGALLLKWLG